MVKWVRSLRPDALSVRTHIALLAASLVLASVAAGTVVVALYALRSVEEETGRRAMHVARTVAQISNIQQSVNYPGGSSIVQPIAERIRLANDVDYVVVLNMNGRRLSHPLPDRIGTQFTGGDEGPAFAEHSYVSAARGIQGNSVRAFVPIMSDSRSDQVGVVVVGLLTPSVLTVLNDVRPTLSLLIAVAMVVGLGGAWLLGSRIKQQLLGLEPPEIARLMQERLAILDALGEGVLAIDWDQRITVMNDEARRIMGASRESTGQPIGLVVPNSRLPEILHAGTPELNQEMLLGHTEVLTNRVPVRIAGRIIGAVATFRDRTEVHRLAEQLTGVSTFVESLRAQNHEHMNRLHTIAGLIQLGRHETAIDYIFSSYAEQQEITQFLTRRFLDFRIAGLLLGKLHRARELGITLTLDPKSQLRFLPTDMESSSIVVLLGNLLENAMDAVLEGSPERKQVYCLIQDSKDSILVVVSDQGPGVPEHLYDTMWQAGFSSKPGPHRGVGLSLVKQHVHHLAGGISFESSPHGTMFTVWLPLKPKHRKGVERA
jgi:two-component system sensor histidine kinase DctS